MAGWHDIVLHAWDTKAVHPKSWRRRHSHVVLHRLNHDAVLLRRVRHLHAASAADGWVRHVAVAANLVRRVNLQGWLVLRGRRTTLTSNTHEQPMSSRQY